jgi:6-pyruvoyltetrahydropterin/6-carboxytetrahydropterin synthase
LPENFSRLHLPEKEMEIYKEFAFDAAHFLPLVPAQHKCRGLHGHTYHLRVYIKGKPDKENGWIVDFKELKDRVLPLIDQLDHKLINKVKGLENPTAENITIWFWNHLKTMLPGLSKIELKETATTGVIYSGE